LVTLRLPGISIPYMITFQGGIDIMSDDKYNDKTIEMFGLMDKGLSLSDARTLVKPTQTAGKQADYKMQAKYKQWSMTHPKRIKKAVKVYDNALSGNKLTPNSTDNPSNSQVLAVAREILDRQEPKVTINQNLSVSVDLTPVDLERYRVKPPEGVV
jgi:hypothetical protein